MEPHQVLIYYANDCPSAEPYVRIRAWLQESGDPDFQKLAERIAEDLVQFPNAVSRDLGEIWQGLLAGEDPLANLGLLVATNGFAQHRTVLAGTLANGLRRVDLPLPSFTHVQFQHHPLSHPDVFQSVMEIAGAAFGPAADYSVVTKSHGNLRMALTSLLSAMLDVPGRDEFLAMLSELRSSGENKTFFEKVRGSPDETQGIYGLGLNGLGNMLGELSNGVGAVKQRYLESLSGGTPPRSIGCLVMEACDSVLAEADLSRVPATVSRLFTAREFVPYSSIPYQKILRQTAAGVRLAESLSSQLPAFFASQR